MSLLWNAGRAAFGCSCERLSQRLLSIPAFGLKWEEPTNNPAEDLFRGGLGRYAQRCNGPLQNTAANDGFALVHPTTENVLYGAEKRHFTEIGANQIFTPIPLKNRMSSVLPSNPLNKSGYGCFMYF
jgi:hypothetical protein